MTKLENRLRDLPPSKLRLKLGNHSPVFWGTSGGGSGVRDGDPLGVIVESEASLRLFIRLCEGGSSRSGACVKSEVN